jgi:hypothetical protein
MESCISQCDTHETLNSGWQVTDNTVLIKWEENIESIKKSLKYKKPALLKTCSCKTKQCGMSERGCKNCYKDCKPCSTKCACKGLCKNPHNNGGACSRCDGTGAVAGSASKASCSPVTSPVRRNSTNEDLSGVERHIQVNNLSDSESDISSEYEEQCDSSSDEEIDANATDFRDLFSSTGLDAGLIELAPVSAFDDDFISDYIFK